MAEDQEQTRRAEVIMAAVTIGFALLLAGIAVSVLRSREPRKPCGCQDKEAPGGD